MSATQMYWMSDERNLIEAIKGYPEIYRKNVINPGKHKTYLNNLYAKLGEFLTMNPRIIKKYWCDIYVNYSKIRSLIRKNNATEEYLKDQPLTKKYLDGTLSFLDDYVPIVDGVILSDVIPVINNNNNKSDDTPDNCKYANETVVDKFMIKSMILIREKREKTPNLDNIDIEFIKKALMDQPSMDNASKDGAKTAKRRKPNLNVLNGKDLEDVIPENVLIPRKPCNKNQNASSDNANNTEIDMRGFLNKLGDVAEGMTEDKKKLLVSKINAIVFEMTQSKIL